MNTSRTVLEGLTKGDIRTDLSSPYVTNLQALPETLANQLRNSFPSIEVMTSGRVGKRRKNSDGSLPTNKKITLYFDEALDMPEVADVWKELVSSHTGYDLFMQFLHVFGEELYTRSPSLRDYLKDLSPADIGLTGRSEDAGKKILIDGGLSMDTAGTDDSAPVIHLDNPRRIANVLWYIRDTDDVQPGGDLEFFETTGPVRVNSKMMVYPEYRSNLNKIGAIPFRHNTMFAFLNSPIAFHGVQPRPILRRSLNLGFLVNYDLHDMSSVRESWLQTRVRKLLGKD